MIARAAIPVVAWAACGLAGCASWPHDSQAPQPMPGAMPRSAAASDPAGLQEALVVQIRMYSIEVPLGAASGSEEIWSYLNEESVRPSPALLGQNGIRVGLAGADAWPALERILTRLTGRQVAGAVFTAFPGAPMDILLKPRQGDQTIFTFSEDRTLSGRDYPPSDNVLTILCSLNLDEPNRLLLAGRPQLRSTQQTTRLVDDRTGFLMVTRPVLYDFDPLGFQMTVSNGELVVIGPGAAARRPDSVGRHFLLKDRGGIPFETVLVLIPRVARVPVQTVPAGARGSPSPF